MRGKQDGVEMDEARLVSSCSRCINPYRPDDYRALMEVAVSDDLEIIVSNTTEAGIAYDPSCQPTDEPPASFPAKLAQVLHARWAAGKPGVIVLSCELIDNNGAELLRIVRQHVADWGWEDAFDAWLTRIARSARRSSTPSSPGASAMRPRPRRWPSAWLRRPVPCRARALPDVGHPGRRRARPEAAVHPGRAARAFVTPDVTPYKKRKVRILNGAHTGFVPGAWLAGFDIVRDCMHDDVVRGLHDTGCSSRRSSPRSSAELDEADLRAFAAAVQDRFDNPFIDHQLLSICLNSTAKWRARDLPTLLDYVEKTGELPRCLTVSLAALIAFYTTGFEGRDDDGLHLRRADGTAYTAHGRCLGARLLRRARGHGGR